MCGHSVVASEVQWSRGDSVVGGNQEREIKLRIKKSFCHHIFVFF